MTTKLTKPTQKRAKDKKPVNSQSLPSIKNTGDYLHVIPDDIDMGEIYKLTSTSGKSYIGQAQCYTMSDGKFEKWGSEKRWKSHISEANSAQDHSVILNNAIRKYGEAGFTLNILYKGPMNTLNDMETKLIKEHNTLTPNGYNIMKGGTIRGMSDEARERVIAFRTGRKQSDKTQLYKAITKLQNSDSYKSNPQYIIKSESSIQKYFNIKYPIINDRNITFIEEQFTTMNVAIKRVAELEELYKSTTKLDEIKKKRLEENAAKKDEEVLPEYITAIYQSQYKIGYKVSGFKYSDGTIAPDKDFIEYANIYNLRGAIRHIAALKIEDKDKGFTVPKLPLGLRYFREVNRIGAITEGFCVIIGHKRNTKGESRPVTKKICDMKTSLEDKYNMALKLYNETRQ